MIVTEYMENGALDTYLKVNTCSWESHMSLRLKKILFLNICIVLF